MGYVMVPVPEEFVHEAMKMIIRLTQGDRVNEWDQEGISELFHEVPETWKVVLSAVARATLGAEGSINDEVLARSMEHTVREVREIARSINTHATDNSYAKILSINTQTETLPNGRTRDDRRFTMADHIAEWVREAEREEAKSAPHPLLGDNG